MAFDVPAEDPDGRGGVEVGWTLLHECRAEMIYARGSEAIEAARLEGRAIFKMRIRQCAAARSITADCRMRDLKRQGQDSQGQYVTGVYQVREADMITDRDWIYVVVESGVPV